MANTYSWVISDLESYPKYENYTNVVFAIHWRRQATDGNGHVGDIYGLQTVTLDSTKPFTPYSELTFLQVIGWLEASFTAAQLAEMNDELDKQVTKNANLPVVLPLPWK